MYNLLNLAYKGIFLGRCYLIDNSMSYSQIHSKDQRKFNNMYDIIVLYDVQSKNN